jgi:tetratricopeptide (TPR) repeat protein
MGDYSRAEPLFRQALEITKKVLGEEHPHFATSLNNLGSLYDSMGDYSRAEPLYRQALEIKKKVLGEEHPITPQV